jgi:hypothetical protein
MNPHNQSWREINFRDRVVIIKVTPWVEAVAVVAAFFMIIGLLDLLERMR